MLVREVENVNWINPREKLWIFNSHEITKTDLGFSEITASWNEMLRFASTAGSAFRGVKHRGVHTIQAQIEHHNSWQCHIITCFKT